MGCTKIGHRHTWPTEGLLVIQRCEIRCNFCTGEAAKKSWKYAWFLRRHVRAIHVGKKGQGEYPNLVVDDSWDDTKLQHQQLKKLLAGKKPSDIKYVEQPEFEEQRMGGVYHLGSGAIVKQEHDGDADMFNGGAREFYGDETATYPALAGEEPALAIQNPFDHADIEGFLRDTALGQTEYPDDEPPTGFVEVGDITNTSDRSTFLDPEVLNSSPPATVSNPAETLRADRSNNNVFGPPDIDWSAAPRFYMDDYDDEGDVVDTTELDELPLAQVQHHYQAQPSIDNYGQLLSMLDDGAQQMMVQGMQPTDMLPAISMFARSLIAGHNQLDGEMA